MYIHTNISFHTILDVPFYTPLLLIPRETDQLVSFMFPFQYMIIFPPFSINPPIVKQRRVRDPPNS